jgi:hypothetical protein
MGNMVDYLLASSGGGAAAPAPVGSLAAAFSAAQSGGQGSAASGGTAGAPASGATGVGTTPPAAIDPAKQLESTLTGTLYPQIQNEVTNAFNGAPKAPGAGNGFFGSLAANEGLTGTGALGAFQDVKLALSALNPLGWPMLLGGVLKTLFGGDKASPPVPGDFGWNSATGSSSAVPTDLGTVNLPTPSASYASAFGLTPAQLAALGPGVADAYPFGQGAPYTAGSGVYEAQPFMGLEEGPLTGAQGWGGFFEPGTIPQTYFPTDYFGNVIGGASSFATPPNNAWLPADSTSLSPTPATTNLAADQPLGIGKAAPAWLSSEMGNWSAANAAVQNSYAFVGGQ